MGNKKQQHLQQSMGNMVSKAALAQMGPAIERYVQALVQNLGSQVATQTASTMETLFSRIVVLESIIMEKYGLTKEDLATKVSNLEDEKEGLKQVEGGVEKNDIVRLEIKTKAKDQTEYQGSSLLKVYKTGSGETLGEELETPILGMKAGETKTVEFGKDKQMVAEISINRISRAEKTEESKDAADQTQG